MRLSEHRGSAADKIDPSRPTATKWAIAYEDTGGLRTFTRFMARLAAAVQQNGFTIFTAATAPIVVFHKLRVEDRSSAAEPQCSDDVKCAIGVRSR